MHQKGITIETFGIKGMIFEMLMVCSSLVFVDGFGGLAKGGPKKQTNMIDLGREKICHADLD